MNETVVSYLVLLKREQSACVDFLIAMILMLIASQVLDAIGTEKETPYWVNIVMFIAIWGIYEPFCTAFGCTVGNYITRIRVRRVEDMTRRLPLWRAYLRYMLKITLGLPSFVIIHFNSQRRAIHDFGSGSVMIEKV